jgi:hypothetical protein
VLMCGLVWITKNMSILSVVTVAEIIMLGLFA